jgi:hypothetical protein
MSRGALCQALMPLGALTARICLVAFNPLNVRLGFSEVRCRAAALKTPLRRSSPHGAPVVRASATPRAHIGDDGAAEIRSARPDPHVTLARDLSGYSRPRRVT